MAGDALGGTLAAKDIESGRFLLVLLVVPLSAAKLMKLNPALECHWEGLKCCFGDCG